MSSNSDQHASPGPIGGANGDAGVEYRRAVAAYAISHGLAGERLPGFGFPLPAASVTEVYVETDEHVDDVLVKFTSGRRSMIQAKRDLKLGRNFTKACVQWAAAARDGADPRLFDRCAWTAYVMPQMPHRRGRSTQCRSGIAGDA